MAVWGQLIFTLGIVIDGWIMVKLKLFVTWTLIELFCDRRNFFKIIIIFSFFHSPSVTAIEMKIKQ